MGDVSRGSHDKVRLPMGGPVMAGILAVLAATALVYGLADLPRRQMQAGALIVRSLEVIDAAGRLETDLERMVSEGRSYILSGNAARMADVDRAEARLHGDIAALAALTADNPAQLMVMDNLAALVVPRIAILRDNIALAEAGDTKTLQQHLQRRVARVLTEAIRADLRTIRDTERALLAVRQAAADRATWETVAALAGAGFLAAASALLAFMLYVGRKRERLHLRNVQQTQTLMRTILETTPGLIYAKDLQGRIILANPAVLAFLGKPRDAVIGYTERAFLADRQEAEAVIANDHRVLAEGRTQVLEETVGREGDSARIWLSTKTPLRDPNGAIVGLFGMSVDITERKQAEQRLRAFNAELEANVAARTAELVDSEARQRAYFYHSPIGMIVMRARDDGDFVLEQMNPAARAAFGFHPECKRGLTQTEMWPELVARDKQMKMQACASRREVIDYSVTRMINGEPRQLDIVLAPLLDDAIEARSVLLCVRDVTRQRALERQVIEQAERQAEAAEREMALFRNSPDELFVVRVDDRGGQPDFIFEAFSPALRKLTGLRAESLVGRRPEECLPAAVARSAVANYRRCLRERATVYFADTRSFPVGQIDVEGSIAPVINPTSGRIVRLVGIARDVTERNRMEVARRHGQRMEAIGRLAAGVAHDFNNILQAIISGLDLVVDEAGVGTPLREYASVALGSAMRGSQLTHHLLCYARKQMLWPQTIQIGVFLTEIEQVLARTLGPQIAVVVRADQRAAALADPGELETALLNLAVNAAQAMPRGGTLRIDAGLVREADRIWVALTLTDTGTGMDDATLAQAMEPFFSTKGAKGTGLGLSMVQGFAEQSGGTLRIASAPGRGTTVELRLPASIAAQPDDPSAPPEPPLTASGRVLLVDDSPDVLVTVGAFLEKAGFDVVRAENGDAALAHLAASGRFDALVSDYAMPGLNGADLILQARQIQPGLHALIITGFAALSPAGLGDGTVVLHKPFHRRALIEALLQAMGRDPAAAARIAAGEHAD
jgi:PAS domain S-box-containing protein